MKTVYKYTLTKAVTRLQVPGPGKVVLFGPQDRAMCVWIEADTDASPETVELEVVGTGNPKMGDGEHVYSALFAGGTLVFHLYRRQKDESK